MSSLRYLQVSQAFTTNGTVLTVTVNSLLIHLTMFHVKDIKPAYKFLIVLQAALGILFSVNEIFIHPFMHSFNASFIFFSSSFTSKSRFDVSLLLNTILLGLYSFTYMFLICGLSIQFIYRYILIMKPKYLKLLFRGWKSLFWLLYCLPFMAMWIFALTQTQPDEYSKEYLKQEMLDNYGADINYIPHYPNVAYDQNQQLRVKAVFVVLEYSIVLLSLYTIIVYCGFRIHFGIKSIMDISSAKVHRLHTQLFRTLVLQVTVPSVFFNSPVFFLYIMPFFDLKWSVPSGIMVAFFSFYPAIDSLILIWMVNEYNRVLRKLLYNFLSWVAELLGSDDDEDSSHGGKRTESAVAMGDFTN